MACAQKCTLQREGCPVPSELVMEGGPMPAKVGKARSLPARSPCPCSLGLRPFAVVTWGLASAEETGGRGHWLDPSSNIALREEEAAGVAGRVVRIPRRLSVVLAARLRLLCAH